MRSTKEPTAERLYLPLMRSPSQWPGTARVSTSFGLSAIGVMSCNCPRRSWPRARGRLRAGHVERVARRRADHLPALCPVDKAVGAAGRGGHGDGTAFRKGAGAADGAVGSG